MSPITACCSLIPLTLPSSVSREFFPGPLSMSKFGVLEKNVFGFKSYSIKTALLLGVYNIKRNSCLANLPVVFNWMTLFLHINIVMLKYNGSLYIKCIRSKMWKQLYLQMCLGSEIGDSHTFAVKFNGWLSTIHWFAGMNNFKSKKCYL